MKRLMFWVGIIVVTVLFPMIVFAQPDGQRDPSLFEGWRRGITTVLFGTPAPPDYGEFEVLDQLLGDDNQDARIGSYVDTPQPFTTLFNRIIEIVIGLTVLIGVGMVVAGGYLYMTAQGSAEQVKTGKDFIKKALLAIVLALASVLLLNTISPQFGSEIEEPPKFSPPPDP